MEIAVDTPGDVTRELEPRRAALAAASREELRAERRAKALANFAPNGPWAYAPESEKQAAAKKFDDEENGRKGEAAFVLEQVAHAYEAEIAQWEAAAQEPLDPFRAWQRERRTSAVLPPTEVMQLSILDELRIARFDRTLEQAKPSAVHAAYTAALANPVDQTNASLIRWVEARHTKAWTGRDVDGNKSEALAAHDLVTAIRGARESRIPEDVRMAKRMVEQALKEVADSRAELRRPWNFTLVKKSA